MEPTAQVAGLLPQPFCLRAPAKALFDGGHRMTGTVGIGLHLTQGDGALGQAAVSMVNGIVAVLPALVAQPPLGGAEVAQEAIRTAGLRHANPGHGTVEGRPQAADEVPIVAAQQVVTRKHQKQGRGIDTAVIAAERHLSEGRHLPQPGLMEDLAAFGITDRILVAGLLIRQEPQNAPCQPGLHQEHLAGGDQPVAAEGTAEPGDTGIGVKAVVQLAGEQMHIRGGARHPAVEGGVVGADRGGEQPVQSEPLNGGQQGRIKGLLGRDLRTAMGVEIKFKAEAAGAAGFEFEGEVHPGTRHLQQRQPQTQGRAAILTIQSAVDHLQALGGGAMHAGAAVAAVVTAHLEDVAEIGINPQVHRHRDRSRGIPGEAELLQQGRGGEQGAAL